MGVNFPEIGWDSEDMKTQTKNKFSLIQKQSVGPGNISVIYYPSGVGIPSLSKVFYYLPRQVAALDGRTIAIGQGQIKADTAVSPTQMSGRRRGPRLSLPPIGLST